MDRKNRILNYFQSKEYVPLKFNELMTVLDVPKEDEKKFSLILKELCDENKIFVTKKGRYAPLEEDNSIVLGKLSCNANGLFGFLICEDEKEDDIFIPEDKMNTALDGDRVLVKIDDTGNTRHREGHVIRVIERENKNIVGVVYKEKDSTFRIRPDRRQIYAKIRVVAENMMEAEIGDRVAVEITEYTETGKVFGRVTSVLGAETSLKSCIEGIILDHGIKHEFDIETVLEAEHIEQSVSQGEIKKRTDLRDCMIFTIDGDDARDFDDAVSVKRLENGNYYLGVHIADVTHYVHEGSALDSEAFERATSVYLADRVIPMLPKSLSNGICSLNPDVDRLTLSMLMEVNKSGIVVKHSLEKTVINSKKRMTYNKVTDILENPDSEFLDEYKAFLPSLKLMEELAAILRKKRDTRGSIEFDFPETKVRVDSDGNPVSIEIDERGVSNKIIEEFMLLANETVAEYAFWAEIPFVYRTHEAPSVEKITAFNELIKHFNLSLKGKLDSDTPIHPKALQKILDAAKGTPQERMISTAMLHSLMKADYRPANNGHFGLAAKYYCHFTSPIRRYPDLAIHRILKKFIDGKLTQSNIAHYEAFVQSSSIRSSEAEVSAEYAERDVDDLMKTAYISNYIGQSFEGTIANITGFGMFIELDNLIEGLIRLENMNEDYFEFDEKACRLIGQRTGKMYDIGDRVSIVVAHTDLLLRRIDFVLEQDASKKILKKFEKPSKIRHSSKKRHTDKKTKKYNKKNKRKK